jgi:hypothetical protein
MGEEKKKGLTAKEVSREVERLFLRGLTPDDIMARAKADKWGVTQSALSKAIDDATQRMIDIGAALNLDTELGKALGRLEELYLDAKDKGETKVALDVLRERTRMLRIGDHARRVPVPIPQPEKLSKQQAKSNVVSFSK